MAKENLEKVITDELYDRETRRMTEEMYLEFRKSNFPIPAQPVNYPDAKKHQIVSFIKSGVRIAGYGLLAVDQLIACAFVLILSEVIGIYEELV